jgi:hypothetical protein
VDLLLKVLETLRLVFVYINNLSCFKGLRNITVEFVSFPNVYMQVNLFTGVTACLVIGSTYQVMKTFCIGI